MKLVIKPRLDRILLRLRPRKLSTNFLSFLDLHITCKNGFRHDINMQLWGAMRHYRTE